MFNRKVFFDMIFLHKNKNKILALTIVLASFLIGENAYALGDAGAFFLDLLSSITFVFVRVVGSLIGLFISLFIKVIPYNNFITEQPVLIGWEIIRDLCNMGFVLILLLIAVSSVLQIESYGYRHRLFKIAIMAVLINFSKLFTGFLIDVGQIVMLTFASGVTAIGGGNFMDVLGINQFLSMDISEQLDAYKAAGNKDAADINGWNIATTIILSLVVALIALVVVAAITIILIIRIVALWILVILSPVAYLLAFSPVASGYARQWWSKFSQWLVTGPVMIFFIWLALSTLKSTMNTMFPAESNDPIVGFANIGTPAVMGAFILAAIMLMASLVVAQQLGGIAGRVAGGAYGMITSRGEKMVRGTWSGVKTGADWVNRKQAKAGFLPDLNIKRRMGNLKASFENEKRLDLQEVQRVADEKGAGEGIGGFIKSGLYGSSNFVPQRLQGFLAYKGIRNAVANSWIGGSDTRMGKIDDAKGTQENIEKIIENLEEDKKGVMSHDDYNQEMKRLNGEEIDSTMKITDYTDKLADLVDEIKNLNAAKAAAKATGVASYNGENLTAEELDEKIKEKNKEKGDTAKNLKNEKSTLDNVQKERDKFYDYRSKGYILSSADAQDRRKIIEERIDKFKGDKSTQEDIIRTEKEKQAKYGLLDYEGQKRRAAEISAESAKIITNESGQLAEIARNGIAKGSREQALAAFLKATKNGDLDDILKEWGYNTHTIGLTKEEKEKLKAQGKHDEIEKRKGLHDFTRDILMDQLGMSEQLAHDFESDLSSVAKSIGDTKFANAIKMKGGKLAQNNSLDQMKINAIDINKMDAETVARRGSRYVYGGETINGNFKVHEAGLNFVTSKYDVINKEINNMRFNPMNALKLSEEENMKTLRKAVDTVKVADQKSYMSMLDNLEKYAATIRGMDGSIEKRIDHMSGYVKT